jgi:hypothetical protein
VNVKEGTRRLALVAGFVGLGAGVFPAHDSFLDLRRQTTQHKEFESLVTSDAFNEEVRKSLQPMSDTSFLDKYEVKAPRNKTETEQLDIVQHPTLGQLAFPKDMPFAERNKVIERLEAKAPKPAPREELPPGFKKKGIDVPTVPQSPYPSLASEIRSTFPGAYKDLSDSEIEQKFSAKVRQSEGPWEEYAASAGVKVRGPDNKLYLFPSRTTKDIAEAYFRKKWANVRPIPGSTTSINAGNIKSVTWASGDFAIEHIETQDGRTLYNRDVPSRWLYLLYASYPLFGFVVPWGAIRTVGWVVLGFQKN